eukprot:Amastigsp_a515433_5.p4 type:complete len:110 gc:universal Amastigsp_a515433_5:179-508(+)
MRRTTVLPGSSQILLWTCERVRSSPSTWPRQMISILFTSKLSPISASKALRSALTVVPRASWRTGGTSGGANRRPPGSTSAMKISSVAAAGSSPPCALAPAVALCDSGR